MRTYLSPRTGTEGGREETAAGGDTRQGSAYAQAWGARGREETIKIFAQDPIPLLGVHVRVRVCMCLCLCLYACAFVCVLCECVCMSVRARVCVCARMCVCVCVCVCVHVEYARARARAWARDLLHGPAGLRLPPPHASQGTKKTPTAKSKSDMGGDQGSPQDRKTLY